MLYIDSLIYIMHVCVQPYYICSKHSVIDEHNITCRICAPGESVWNFRRMLIVVRFFVYQYIFTNHPPVVPPPYIAQYTNASLQLISFVSVTGVRPYTQFSLRYSPRWYTFCIKLFLRKHSCILNNVIWSDTYALLLFCYYSLYI